MCVCAALPPASQHAASRGVSHLVRLELAAQSNFPTKKEFSQPPPHPLCVPSWVWSISQEMAGWLSKAGANDLPVLLYPGKFLGRKTGLVRTIAPKFPEKNRRSRQTVLSIVFSPAPLFIINDFMILSPLYFEGFIHLGIISLLKKRN